MKKKEARLIYSADSDFYYATKFSTGDPYPLLQIGDRKILLISDLEYGRARRQAKVNEIVLISKIEKKLKGKKDLSEVIRYILKRNKIKKAVVPYTFPYGLARALNKKGIEVVPVQGAFFEHRKSKSEEEIQQIEKVLRYTEEALDYVVHMLKQSSVREGKLYYEDTLLTSEYLRRVVAMKLLEKSCVAIHTIIACGDQGCDPHEIGSGPLYPDKTIIIDIFPRSEESFYCADITRTVVKGKASDAVKNMYQTVLKAQEKAFLLIKHGAGSVRIHKEVKKVIKDAGFVTKKVGDKMIGFFHGTGHGLGLDVHELPRISKKGERLKAGNVVTVEPGLYYPGVGAVRLEDIVVVEKNGCRVLTKYPKVLEV